MLLLVLGVKSHVLVFYSQISACNAPETAINDNYCDCLDGSDEPLTSACDYRFLCQNKPFVSKYIPSSMVGDGICDCCDGSDEPNCPNTCDELLKDAQSKLKAKRQIWEMGLRAKKDLIKVGKLQKIARSSKIAQAIRHQSTLNAKCARLLNLKNAAFELQKTQKPPNHIRFVSLQSKFKTLKAKFELISSAYSSVLDEVAKLQSPADSIVQPNEQEKPLNLQAESIVQPPNLPADSIVQPNEQAKPPLSYEEAAKMMMGNRDKILEYAGQNKNSFYDQFGDNAKLAVYPDVKEASNTKEEGDDDDDQELNDSSAQLASSEASEKVLAYLKSRFDSLKYAYDQNSKVEEIDNELDELGIENPCLDPLAGLFKCFKTSFGQMYTKALSSLQLFFLLPFETDTVLISNHSKAEEAYEKCISDQRNADNDLEDLKKQEQDYGPQSEWESLKNTCHSIESAGYKYEVCLFDEATQISLNDNNRIRTFKNQSNTENSQVMYYGGGQHCWNGPDRSLQVKLECGPKTEVISVSEPSKCEYYMVLKSPAACSDIEPELDERTEL